MAENSHEIRSVAPAGYAGSELNVRAGLLMALLVLALFSLVSVLTHRHRITSSFRMFFLADPLFTNGAGGYHCYRIPSIVQTPDGTLLAFAEARKNDCDDFGDVRIVMRSSRNDGKSWSGMQTVASNGNLQAGNPVPVVDTTDARYPHGRVFLLYTTANAPELAVQQGHGTARVWYRTSTDEGVKWTPPVEITASVKRPTWRDYAVGSGHGLQLLNGPHQGRIFIPAYHSEGPPQAGARDVAAHGFFSDDHGQTWTLGATIAWPGSNESSAAEANNGSIVMNSRNETGAPHARIISVSRSGGERWDETFVAHDLPDPACEGSMVSYVNPDGKWVLLTSNLLNTDTGHRQGLSLSESTDSGRTWPKHSSVEKEASAYSDLVVMSGRRLGMVWEGHEGVVFRTRPMESLF